MVAFECLPSNMRQERFRVNCIVGCMHMYPMQYGIENFYDARQRLPLVQSKRPGNHRVVH